MDGTSIYGWGLSFSASIAETEYFFFTVSSFSKNALETLIFCFLGGTAWKWEGKESLSLKRSETVVKMPKKKLFIVHFYCS